MTALQAALTELQQQLQAERDHCSQLKQQLLQSSPAQPEGCRQDAAAQACVAVVHCGVQTGSSATEVDRNAAIVPTLTAGDCTAAEWSGLKCCTRLAFVAAAADLVQSKLELSGMYSVLFVAPHAVVLAEHFGQRQSLLHDTHRQIWD